MESEKHIELYLSAGQGELSSYSVRVGGASRDLLLAHERLPDPTLRPRGVDFKARHRVEVCGQAGLKTFCEDSRPYRNGFPGISFEASSV